MDIELVKWLSGLGVGGVLAAFMFAAYRKDMQTLTSQWKGQTELLMDVVRDNTAALTQNTAVIQSLHSHIISNGYRLSDRRETER